MFSDSVYVFLSFTQLFLCLAMTYILLTNGPGGGSRG